MVASITMTLAKQPPVPSSCQAGKQQ